MRYKGLIFDFNGTLFWDTDKQEDSWRVYSEKVRGYPLSDEEMLHKMHGCPNKAVLEYLTGQSLNERDAYAMSQEKEELYRDMCTQEHQLNLAPGAVELLDFLCSRQVPFTIATSSEITNVTFFFEIFNLNKWFDLNKVVYDDGIMPGKPEPDIYVKAAGKIDLLPCDCIVIEDAISGIEAAYRANIGKIIALGPKHKQESLLRNRGVDAVITDFTEFDRDLI